MPARLYPEAFVSPGAGARQGNGCRDYRSLRAAYRFHNWDLLRIALEFGAHRLGTGLVGQRPRRDVALKDNRHRALIDLNRQQLTAPKHAGLAGFAQIPEEMEMSRSKIIALLAGSAALGLAAGNGTIALAQQGSQDVIGTLGDNEGIFVDGKTFKIARGKAKGDPGAQIAKLSAKEVGPGAIVFRYDGKLYMVEGQPEAAPQAMKNFQDNWSVSYMKNMKDFQDNWAVSFVKDFQDNWNKSYLKGDNESYAQTMKNFQDNWNVSFMKDFQDNWNTSYMKNFQDNWNTSYMKNFQDNWNTSYMKDFQDNWNTSYMKNFQDNWNVSYMKQLNNFQDNWNVSYMKEAKPSQTDMNKLKQLEDDYKTAFLKEFQDNWNVSYMKAQKDFQDNWNTSYMKNFQDNWNTSYMKEIKDFQDNWNTSYMK
jgi:hypothetical protein